MTCPPSTPSSSRKSARANTRDRLPDRPQRASRHNDRQVPAGRAQGPARLGLSVVSPEAPAQPVVIRLSAIRWDTGVDMTATATSTLPDTGAPTMGERLLPP